MESKVGSAKPFVSLEPKLAKRVLCLLGGICLSIPITFSHWKGLRGQAVEGVSSVQIWKWISRSTILCLKPTEINLPIVDLLGTFSCLSHYHNVERIEQLVG